MKNDLFKPDFVAIDFEHATSMKGTICSVGIVSFKNGRILDCFYSLIQPPGNEYGLRQTNKHKIEPIHTANAPSFLEVFPEIALRLNNNTVVAHGANHTDKVCLKNAMKMNGITTSLNINWIDSQKICNSRLEVAAKVIGIKLNHHHALSDAKVCGIIYQKYLDGSLPIEEINIENMKEKEKDKSSLPKGNLVFPKKLPNDVYKPNFEHAKNKSTPIYKKNVVLTGFLGDENHKVSVQLRDDYGAKIDRDITSKTSYLIIGDGKPGPKKLKKMKEKKALGLDVFTLKYSELLKMLK